jgi:hypothetical protein
MSDRAERGSGPVEMEHVPEQDEGGDIADVLIG